MSYDGVERRKTMDKEIQDIKIELAAFIATVKEWMSTTTDYRKILCEKIAVVQEKLNELPCRERNARYTSQQVQIKWLWLAITFLTGINGLFISVVVRSLVRAL